MQVLRHIPKRAPGACVLTIGNFDGVHLGHQALLRRLREHAQNFGVPSAVLSFEPHPREFFAPQAAPSRISNIHDKLVHIAAQGVEQFYLCRFDTEFASMPAQMFIQRILVQRLGVQALLVGDDFRFGAQRQGNFTMLQEAGKAHGFVVESLSTFKLDNERVSSSAVREALLRGNLDHAKSLLGRDYEMSGRVVHGQKIGRTLNFPTANILVKQASLPLAGIFAVEVSGPGLDSHPGAASIGVRPTLDLGLAPILEVYLLDFSGELYGSRLTVRFLHRLRDEIKFDSLTALQTQIAADVAAVRQYFQNK